MAGGQTQRNFQINEKKQLLVLVRYKPEGTIGAENMLGGATSAVQGVVDKAEDAAGSIPGLNLFFKEEKEPEKKTEKEYNFYKDYSEWNKYFDKMKNELVNKLNNDNEIFVFDFDASDAEGRKREGKKLFDKIKQKTGAWKDYTACFHFVGLGHGGNVANECIHKLTEEADFKKKWWVQSVIYVGTSLYKNQHTFNEAAALRGKGKIYAFGNAYDLTQNAIAYFEPNDKLLKLIAECNANLLSVFTGKLKTQLVATLGRLLSIEGFGTGHDNAGNIDKLTQCKDDVKDLVTECVDACRNVLNAFPDIVKPPDLPKFDQMLSGFDAVPGKSVKRLEKFIDELKKVRQGTSLDTSRISIAKLFNFLCPLIDQLTGALKLFSVNSETSNQLFDQVMEKADIKKVLAPAKISIKTLPVDPYIEDVAKKAKAVAAQEAAAGANDDAAGSVAKTKEQILYDQANVMISTCTSKIAAAAKNSDLDMGSQNADPGQKQLIAEAMTAMLLPMLPSKKKFYSTLLEYVPLDGLNGFLEKLTGDAAFSPLKTIMCKVKAGFDFDEGTDEEPGLKKSLQNFDTELKRIKGFLNKNNYPVHKDANSLYFIYNAHNLMLKKPYGEILNTIDKETGYLDYMQSIGCSNFCNVDTNGYHGSGSQKGNEQPVTTLKGENKNA
ncbi:MAG: hypothetical protein QM640_01705 [Niabella sp.]